MFELIKNKNRLNRIDYLFNNMLNNTFSSSNIHSDSFISSDDNNYYIEIAIPGVDKKDINLSIERDFLKLACETGNEDNVWNKSFCQNFQLPEDVNENSITAELKNGILSIKLEKDKKSIKIKTIDIK